MKYKEPKISNQEIMKGETRYEVEKKVGCGTFGTVHKARDRKTLDVVAIKKVYQDRNYKNRELDILNETWCACMPLERRVNNTFCL